MYATITIFIHQIYNIHVYSNNLKIEQTCTNVI